MLFATALKSTGRDEFTEHLLGTVSQLTQNPRFQGVARLYGTEALEAFGRSHVMLVGLGGVGSWAAEALARSGVGEFTLVDLDDLCPSNANRQLHALDPHWGELKVTALEQRLRAINPDTIIHAQTCFYSSANAADLLAVEPSLIVDCIDALKPKAHLCVEARRREIPLLISGAAGGRTDLSQIRSADLARVEGDALLRQLRKKLREEHGFPRGDAKSAKNSRKFGLTAVYSTQEPLLPPQLKNQGDDCELGESAQSQQSVGNSLRLNCDFGYGTSCPIVASFGLHLAALGLDILAEAELV